MGGLAGVPPSDLALCPCFLQEREEQPSPRSPSDPSLPGPLAQAEQREQRPGKDKRTGVGALWPDASVTRVLGLCVLRNCSSREYKEMLTSSPWEGINPKQERREWLRHLLRVPFGEPGSRGFLGLPPTSPKSPGHCGDGGASRMTPSWSWLCLCLACICLCPPGSPLPFHGSFCSFQFVPAGVLGVGTNDTERVKGWDIGTVGCRL